MTSPSEQLHPTSTSSAASSASSAGYVESDLSPVDEDIRLSHLELEDIKAPSLGDLSRGDPRRGVLDMSSPFTSNSTIARLLNKGLLKPGTRFRYNPRKGEVHDGVLNGDASITEVATASVFSNCRQWALSHNGKRELTYFTVHQRRSWINLKAVAEPGWLPPSRGYRTQRTALLPKLLSERVIMVGAKIRYYHSRGVDEGRVNSDGCIVTDAQTFHSCKAWSASLGARHSLDDILIGIKAKFFSLAHIINTHLPGAGTAWVSEDLEQEGAPSRAPASARRPQPAIIAAAAAAAAAAAMPKAEGMDADALAAADLVGLAGNASPAASPTKASSLVSNASNGRSSVTPPTVRANAKAERKFTPRGRYAHAAVIPPSAPTAAPSAQAQAQAMQQAAQQAQAQAQAQAHAMQQQQQAMGWPMAAPQMSAQYPMSVMAGVGQHSIGPMMAAPQANAWVQYMLFTQQQQAAAAAQQAAAAAGGDSARAAANGQPPQMGFMPMPGLAYGQPPAMPAMPSSMSPVMANAMQAAMAQMMQNAQAGTMAPPPAQAPHQAQQATFSPAASTSSTPVGGDSKQKPLMIPSASPSPSKKRGLEQEAPAACPPSESAAVPEAEHQAKRARV